MNGQPILIMPDQQLLFVLASSASGAGTFLIVQLCHPINFWQGSHLVSVKSGPTWDFKLKLSLDCRVFW
jgi:hypothetical protein